MAWYARDLYRGDPIGWGANQLGRAGLCFLLLPIAVFGLLWWLEEYPDRLWLHVASTAAYFAWELVTQAVPSRRKGWIDVADDTAVWTLVSGLILWSFLEVARYQLTLEPQVGAFFSWLTVLGLYAAYGVGSRAWVAWREANGDG